LPQGEPCNSSKTGAGNDVEERIDTRTALNNYRSWYCQENQQKQGWSND
jgi:hypothetical protein